jgi:hypothetical protein
MVRNGALSHKIEYIKKNLGDSKSLRTSKLHYWLKSYGNFTAWMDFSYWTKLCMDGFFLLDKVVKLVGGGSVIKGAYPV